MKKAYLADILEPDTVEKIKANDGVFCTIRWSLEDLKEVFRKRDIPFTIDNIQKFIDGRGTKTLHERSVEEGWTILDDLVTIIFKEEDNKNG